MPSDLLGGTKHFARASLMAGYKLSETSCPRIDFLPQSAICESSHKALPDFFLVNGVPCISSQLRHAIALYEREDDVQFFPVEIYRKNKSKFDGYYYYMNILAVKNFVIIERSNLEYMHLSSTQSVIISPARLKNWRGIAYMQNYCSALWRDKTYMRDIYLCDALAECVLSAKMRGFPKSTFFQVDLYDGHGRRAASQRPSPMRNVV